MFYLLPPLEGQSKEARIQLLKELRLRVKIVLPALGMVNQDKVGGGILRIDGDSKAAVTIQDGNSKSTIGQLKSNHSL